MLIEKSECDDLKTSTSEQSSQDVDATGVATDTGSTNNDIYNKIISLFEQHKCSDLSDDSNKTKMLTYCLRMNNKCHDTQINAGSPILTEKLMKDIKNTARKCNSVVDSEPVTGE